MERSAQYISINVMSSIRMRDCRDENGSEGFAFVVGNTKIRADMEMHKRIYGSNVAATKVSCGNRHRTTFLAEHRQNLDRVARGRKY